MKIIMGGRPDETKVYTDDGVDLTEELCITELQVTATAGRFPEVRLICQNWKLDAEFDYESIAVSVEHTNLEPDKTEKWFIRNQTMAL